MKALITSTLNTALNTLLQLDTESQRKLHKLEGKVISIELLPFHITLQFLISHDALHLQEQALLEPDITIRGTPLQMTALAFNQDKKQRFFADDIHIEGNAMLAQDVLHLFNQLHIDWEELLAHLVGDTAAYHAGKLARRAGSWLRQVEQSLTSNVDEYVHEEARWFPTREALQDLFDEIDHLKMDVDRIEARIARLL